MMDRFAPNTAALDTPSVAGEAIGLPSTVCMISPDTDNPAPAITAASSRGRRMCCMIRTAALSPLPNSAETHCRTDIPEDPTSSSNRASSTTAAASAAITAIFLFRAPSAPMSCLPRLYMVYHTSIFPTAQPG